ncbi:Maf family protein [Corynebacterium alimapuense]|uniref:Nucleoside triphosphate pyrophosphatase n=1 Tax=Corynebacterium alimapuense TaxID=1576874 RepID=A0A3M8K6D6_9CORY|nr:Maf family nucleotide pyrophosphatase [Corynebacterium alimapuense]RNE48783.1 septum formation inhibitor Maf [Corynebacterium alimapuense]
MRLVLASASPSRRMILNSAGVQPLLRPTQVDEEAIAASLGNAPAGEVVAALAQAKADAVAAEYPDDVVIGGDSMLLLGDKLQGKPLTVENTIQRWREQAGATAELLTGHCIIYGEQRVLETTRTTVTFAEASETDIIAYARSGEPLHCAGAFTLEALGGWFIDRIEGDPSSVIGLSLPLLRRALYSFGLDVSQFWES